MKEEKNYRQDGQLFEEFLEEATTWKNLTSKYEKNKIWARVPNFFDHIKNVKGKLTLKVFEYEMDKNGVPIDTTEKLVGTYSGPNMVVKWAKIPIAFLLAGWKFKVGKAWESVYTSENLKYGYGGEGAGRTRGIKSATTNSYFEPPLINSFQLISSTDYTEKGYLAPSNISENNNVLLWNPYNTLKAQFPFFPTKMRFGDIQQEENTTSITEDSNSIIAFNRETELIYEKMIFSSADNYTIYQNVLVDDNVNKIKYFDFSGTNPKYRPFIYVTRVPNYSSDLYLLSELQNIVENKSIYIAKSIANSVLNSIVFNVIMPQYPTGTPYPYDNVLIQQAELKCDAGSYGLIDGLVFDSNWYVNYNSKYKSDVNYNAYYNMKDGITYAIRTIPTVKKSSNNKLVFSWVLYL